MRKSIFAALFVGISFCCMSCDLEMKNYSALYENIFPSTEADAETLVTGSAYMPFRSAGYVGLFAPHINGIFTMTEITTDIGDCKWFDPIWIDLINVNFNTDDDMGCVWFYRNYNRWITGMTRVFPIIEKINMPEESRERMYGELYCGRGWLAYLLYDLYGPLQFATQEVLDNPTKNIIVPRSTKEETVKFIEDNLKEAIKRLPATYKHGTEDYGRFTKGLAYTVLMKLYMHEGRWSEAVECGRELMKPEYGYDLVPEYKDIFTLENEGNAETIWSCVSSIGGNAQIWLSHVYTSNYPKKNQKQVSYGGYAVPWKFYDTFHRGDERLEVLVSSYEGTDGMTYSRSMPGQFLHKGALPVKYGEDPETIGEGSGVDYIVYRYADVLTMLAEAIVRDANNVTDEAVALLNRVHTRAGLSPFQTENPNPENSSDAYTYLDGSVTDFLNKVLEERGHELWWEGCRRTDLIRHGKYIRYAQTLKGSSTAKPHMVLFPLPQDVIEEGKGKVIQNDGY